MQLETLFKRTKTGAVQYYKVWTNTIDSAGNQFSVIFKESGQLGTKNPVIHKEEVHEGKNLGKSNATTAKEQAELQAKSDHKSKLDEGYKSTADLNITELSENNTIWSIYKEQKLGLYQALELALPKFNTGVGNIPLPMLAKDWKKVKNITYPCYIQPKLDGVRALLIANSKDDIYILSRSGKPYNTLAHIINEIWLKGNELTFPFILDGEVYNHTDLNFQEVVSAVKAKKSNSLKLQFRAYDIVNGDNQDKRWRDTFNLVKAINSPLITAVDTELIANSDMVKSRHDAYIQLGYEGAMLRMCNGHYEQGQRSSHLLKVKEFQEDEFDFLRWELGQREEDLLAICSMPDGREIKAKMIGTREQKKMLEQRISGRITVKYFGLTTDGLLRFPIAKSFRDYD